MTFSLCCVEMLGLHFLWQPRELYRLHLKSFLAQQGQRIDRESALRGNPRGEKPEQKHHKHNAT